MYALKTSRNPIWFLYTFEEMLKAYSQKKLLEAGCDEAGRGCLAGPVFAAAVVLPQKFWHPLLNDSKAMKASHRYLLRDIIMEQALAWAVASVDHEEIDRINILKASFKSMHMALDQLTQKPQLILIDGHLFTPYQNIPHRCIIKGDSIYASIAAASVLAKTFRDDFMNEMHEKYPQYKWNSNKGYGTMEHRKAIQEFGLSPIHRKSFQQGISQMEIEEF